MPAKVQGTWQTVKVIEEAAGVTLPAAPTDPAANYPVAGATGVIGGAGRVTDVDTAQKYPLGLRVLARDTGATNYGTAEFTYVKGVTGMAVGDGLSISELGVAVRATTGGPVGRFALAVSAIDAATKFGWVQTAGLGVANVLAAFADDGGVFATSTAGSIDDAVVLGDGAIGATGASAIDTGTALVAFPNGAVFNKPQAAS